MRILDILYKNLRELFQAWQQRWERANKNRWAGILHHEAVRFCNIRVDAGFSLVAMRMILSFLAGWGHYFM